MKTGEDDAEPEEDEDEWYYGLSRRSAEKQDGQWIRFAPAGIGCGPLLVILIFAFSLFSGNWVLGFFLILFFPFVLIFCIALGGFVVPVFLESFRNFFINKDNQK